MEESNTNDISKTPFPYKITKEIANRRLISQLQVTPPIRRLQVINSLYCKYAAAARCGTGCQGILVPAAQYRDCKSTEKGRGTQSRIIAAPAG